MYKHRASPASSSVFAALTTTIAPSSAATATTTSTGIRSFADIGIANTIGRRYSTDPNAITIEPEEPDVNIENQETIPLRTRQHRSNRLPKLEPADSETLPTTLGTRACYKSISCLVAFFTCVSTISYFIADNKHAQLLLDHLLQATLKSLTAIHRDYLEGVDHHHTANQNYTESENEITG